MAGLQNDILGHISYGKKHACVLILKGERSDFPKRGCTITLRRGCRGNWVLCPMYQFSKGLCLSASFPCASQFASSWNVHSLNLVPALHSYLLPSTEISFKIKSPIISSLIAYCFHCFSKIFDLRKLSGFIPTNVHDS